ncbi:hypothetical protein LTR97_005921 [Elasticomyces elasticus]|uniref:Chaperone/heat shock protein Hsp12 n=1 Tax=Elasticomyces elasticus TaxID=574655 RepID=A0AAN7VRF6_9PEZI|nr:hypothetical protein LTR97_005921 [Elasticomyces elasticus]
MSDLGRKDFSTKASEKMTPDSSKSTVDKVTESITNTGDSVSRNTVPGEQKSTSQKAADAVSNTKHNAQHDAKTDDKSMVDKAKDAVGLNKH